MAHKLLRRLIFLQKLQVVKMSQLARRKLGDEAQNRTFSRGQPVLEPKLQILCTRSARVRVLNIPDPRSQTSATRTRPFESCLHLSPSPPLWLGFGSSADFSPTAHCWICQEGIDQNSKRFVMPHVPACHKPQMARKFLRRLTFLPSSKWSK